MKRHTVSQGFAVLALAACTADPDDTSRQPETRDLTGSVHDPYDGDAPVGDAWVVVDTGTELITARTGADGGFSVPALPADRPITVTFAAAERTAVTWTDLLLSDLEGPVGPHLFWRDTSRYLPSPTWLAGTVSGAPGPCWVAFYGDDGSYSYIRVEGPEPADFEVEVTIPEGGAVTVSALALDDAGTALGGAWTATDGSTPLDLVISSAMVATDVHARAPRVDGVPLAGLDMQYCSTLAYTHPAEAWGVLTGYTLSCTPAGDGFDFAMTRLSEPGTTWAVDVSLAADVRQGAFSWASIPFEDAETAIEVVPLDVPILQASGDFAAGSVVTWTIPEAATESYLVATDGAGFSSWWVVDLDDPGRAVFPRLPAELAGVLEATAWTVEARSYVLVDDGQGGYDLSATDPYLVASAPGGAVIL